MVRTTIMLPAKLKARAAREARNHGVSLGQFIRSSMEDRLSRPDRPARDPLLADDFVFTDNLPPDVSANLDKYLYEFEKEGR
jgi:hypothetical protein